jgi:citrate synthase
MSELKPGLEGVVVFETAISEPDRDGGALRYRGVDIEELVGHYPFEKVWGLLVDGEMGAALPAAAAVALPVRSGDPRVDLQVALALLGPLVPLRPLYDLDVAQARHDLALASASALSLVAQAARPAELRPVPQAEVDGGATLAERFLLAWRGEADPVQAKAIDAYWATTAEHGMNASTFTARVVASTGADVGTCFSAAVGALSGPLHGGAPARVLTMLDEVEREGDARRWVRRALGRGERIMGFGHRVYRAEDPRARAMRRTAAELGSARFEVAQELERVAIEELTAHRPDRALRTNVEFWSAVVLDHAAVPTSMFTAMFACARTAGWSAHVLEQKRLNKLVRPAAAYVGERPRSLAAAS